VAARYQPQQYLIGPAFFPTYWFVLRLATFWAFLIYSIVSVVLILTGPLESTAVAEALLRIPVVLMTTAAWVTLIFAVIEFASVHYPAKLPAIPGTATDWSPSALPPVEMVAAHGKKPRSYAHAVAEVIFGFLFLLWWLLVPEHPYLMMGPGAAYLKASPFQLASIWTQFYWWVVALNVLQLGWRIVDLLRGSWRGSRHAQTIAVSIFGLVPLALLLTVRDHAFVLLNHPALDQARYGTALTSINLSIQWSAVAICVITILRLVWEIGRMGMDAYRKRLAAMK